MKDAKIYDGAGWQSLKGPPGPSAPSADDGNLITVGSDGLLMYRRPQGDLQFSGEWTPIAFGDISTQEGYWVRVGNVVTVTVIYDLNLTTGDQTEVLGGLPFSIAESFSPTSSTTGQFAAPVLSFAKGVVGWAQASGQSPDQIVINLRPVSTDLNVFTLTYVTDDARLG